MGKMELIMLGLFFLHILLLLIILWRTEMSVRLLKQRTNVQKAEKTAEYSYTPGHIKRNEEEVSETEESREVLGNTKVLGEIVANEETLEKEKLINEVLSEIFS